MEQAISQSVTTARELWTAARRAGIPQRPIQGPRTKPMTKTAIMQAVRYYWGQVPRGKGPLLDRMAAHLAAHRQAPDPDLAGAFRRRAREYITNLLCAEASRRGLSTMLDLARAGRKDAEWWDETRQDGYRIVLLHAEGYAKYSRRSRVRSAKKALSLVGGWDDAGLWIARVPGTITSVHAALEWLMPAEVRRARDTGKRVLRQGDVWVVERTRDGMASSELPSGHRWDSKTRTLWHDEHQSLHVPFPAVAIRQSTLAADGSGRRRGD